MQDKKRKAILKAVAKEKQRIAYERYWEKVAMHEDGCIAMRQMEINAVRIGRDNK